MLIYSALYKKYYPFNSDAEAYALSYALSSAEKQTLVKWIKKFPSDLRRHFLEEALKKKVKFPSDCPGFPYEYLKKESTELISKFENYQPLSEKDIEYINLVLLVHKYNWFISLFLKFYVVPVDENVLE